MRGVTPIAIDLFCGLGGWCEGLQAVGYRVIGFDNERRDYGSGGYPGQLILQDVLTLDGYQFRNATLIVASPPCQFFSYTAMPWSRAKKWAADVRQSPARIRAKLALFNACLRIQREASEAAGRHIPMVVENVVGAQAWVGPAKWHYGSFYLWGDVPALMIYPGKALDGSKNNGGLWFAVAHNTTSGHSRNPVNEAVKFGGGWWLDPENNLIRKHSSRSNARKQASAMIAKIPRPLAEYIGRVYWPC